jgi:hypothetical protein
MILLRIRKKIAAAKTAKVNIKTMTPVTPGFL